MEERAMAAREERRSGLVVRGVLLAVFVGLVVFLSVRFGPDVTRLVRRPERFKELVDSSGFLGPFVYILVQAAQIVIAAIPGEFVQIAGGYAFGTVLGTIYSIVGTFLGTLIAFFATRLLGYALVRTFVPPKKLESFDFLIKDKRAEIALFALFLIPGIPKDVLVYISGLTPIKPLRFLLISTVARFPGLWGSAYIGANLQEKNYLPVWILSGAALALFVTGALSKDRILGWMKRYARRRRGEGGSTDEP
jgi:uncharacterized membrane protein YdjX (TVP38/TMEM64 family)